MFSLECDLLRRNRYNLKQKAISYESKRSYYEVVLADMGVTRTPSEVVDTDLIYYLVREFTAMGVKDFYSELDGIPHILDIDYLRYRRSFLNKTDIFKKDLDVIIGYLESIEVLRCIYNYEKDIHTIPRLLNDVTKVKLRYLKNSDDFGWYSTVRAVEVGNLYNSLYGEAKRVVRISDIYYKFFSRVTGYSVGELSWTFFKGFNRLSELKYLKFVIEGKIRPTNVDKESYDKYLQYLQDGGQPYKDLLPYIHEELQNAIKKIEKVKGFVKAITPYGVYFYRECADVFKYKKYVTYYCYDYDNNEMLPLENQLNGLGGEFSEDISKSLDGVPYKVKGYDSDRVLYRVGDGTRFRYYDLDFKLTTGILRGMFATRKLQNMVEVTKENKTMIRKDLKEIFR